MGAFGTTKEFKTKGINGIYQIINVKNNKIYIGESGDIHQRWRKHIEDLEQRIHHNSKLQNDFNYFGIESFKFEIIKEIKPTKQYQSTKIERLKEENKYIEQYDTIHTGYNIEDSYQLYLKGYIDITGKRTNEYMEKLVDDGFYTKTTEMVMCPSLMEEELIELGLISSAECSKKIKATYKKAN